MPMKKKKGARAVTTTIIRDDSDHQSVQQREKERMRWRIRRIEGKTGSERGGVVWVEGGEGGRDGSV